MPDGLTKLRRYGLSRLIERAEKDTRQFTKIPEDSREISRLLAEQAQALKLDY